ncbi:LysE/ArgO family amino acid transporter [Antribacter gilvus]|uniref:LysE/ArgO family amino acid transporter n=1 Tax=Antribacter gilvus TaxID=2304675 RepID=UPI0013DFEA87|nr:LysE/ArgO family amino acid transporter [Antribacter gilvus]
MLATTPALGAALAGLGFCMSLIVAIGAQNAFVLRQGLQRSHVALVVALCAGSDTLLVAAGVGGLGSVLQGAPAVVEAVRWLGAAVVLAYGALAARRAWLGTSELALPDGGPGSPEAVAAATPAATPAEIGVGPRDGGRERLSRAPEASVGQGPSSARPRSAEPVPGARPGRARVGAVVGTTLALTWLNPHVYLDTVVLMGGVGSTYGDLRWWFAGGAAVASWAWFLGLGYGARLLAPVLRRPGAWRVVDGVIAVIMLAVAVSLVLG